MALTKADLRERLDESERIRRGLVREVERAAGVVVAAGELAVDLKRVCAGCKLEAHQASCQCHVAVSLRKLERALGARNAE